MAETIERAREAMRNRQRLQHVALNVAKLVNMRRDPVLAADVISSDLVGIDGMGIVWAARCLGLPVKERVAGIDLLIRLLALCAEEDSNHISSAEPVRYLHKGANRVRQKHPSICFAGLRDGYFTPEQELEVVTQIRNSGADCLFIGMPTPRKERFSSIAS